MKITTISWTRYFLTTRLIPAILICLFAISCKKDDVPGNHGAGKYPADVLHKWMTLQIRLMKNSTGIPNQAFSRHYSYSGIAALESLVPGLPGSVKKYRKWNGLTGLPAQGNPENYYYPANLNAALASMNRAFFPNANAVDKAAIDSLESALYESFRNAASAQVLDRSVSFGKSVATAVFNWSETDGYKNASAPYTPPTGPGLWKPTPTGFAAASMPYWGNNRPVIAGSITNTMPPAPPAYSEDEASPFYQMVKQVHDVSKTLTDDEKNMAIFWRDVPGVTTPGHWLNILLQVLQKTKAGLDKAALAYAMSGAAMNDAFISCWKAKYTYNLVRPVTFIREKMGDETWNSFIGTPPHPEYPSAHSVASAATATSLRKLFGNIGYFTDRTYEYLGMAPRTYSSLSSIGDEAGYSRLFAGIHYQVAIDEGLLQGKKVTENIFSGLPSH